MISLLMLACQIEFEQVDTRNVVTKFVEKAHKGRTVEDLWVEQCAAKKAMWL